jgi:microcystin-dependent protein
MVRQLARASVGAIAVLGATSMAPSAGAQELFYIGQIIYMASNYCPAGTSLPADGRLLPIAHYVQVFSVIGTGFGGDGKTTFALPKIEMPGSVPGFGLACIVIQGIYPNRP